MFTINDTVRRAAVLNADGAAVITDDAVITWSQFLNRVQAIAGALRQAGLQRGDRVAILSLNGARYYEFMFGVIWAGGVAAPINTRFAEREIIYCMNDLDGPWLCADDSLQPMADAVQSKVSGLKGLFYVGEGGVPADYLGFDELLKGDPSVLDADPDSDDLALIFYTGGTTGVAKGVMITHRQVKHAAQQTSSGLRTNEPLDETSVYVHLAPMFHMGDGVMCFVAPMVTCANTFMGRFDIPSFVKHCNQHQVGWVTLVPTMVKAICDYLNDSGETLPSLRGIMYGGSPMSEAVLELTMSTLPNVQLFQGYGSTEALIISMLEPQYHTLAPENRQRLRSAGRPFRGVLVGVFDQNGKQLPAGDIGEIRIRSNAVMQGYWNKPELTREAMADNWFRTGDAGYLDDRGFVYLVDRVKDMVITGGENVYSSEVENVLCSHESVAECAVIGLPDDTWGETVHAVVRLREDHDCGEQALSDYCREQIAGYKVPKSFEFVSEPLPLTAAGKLDKVAVRKRRVLE